jgi:PAS domain S-box-containing protein
MSIASEEATPLRQTEVRGEESMPAAIEAALAHSPVVVYRLAWQNGKIAARVISGNINRLLGMTATELVDRGWWVQRLHPEDRERAIGTLAKMNDGGHSHGEYRLRHVDGSYRWVEDSCQSMRDERGDPAGFVGVWTDVTQHKLLEAQAALNDERFNAFFSSANTGLALLNHELRYVQINAKLAEMNGLSVGAHLGRTVEEVVPTVAPNLVPLLQEVLSTGEPVLNLQITGDTRGQRGRRRHWVESFFPVKGPSGKVKGVGVVVVENTAHKEAEERYRETQRQFHEMLANVALIAMTMNRDGAVTFCNDHLLRVTGWKREEVIGCDWFDRFIPSKHPEVKAMFFEMMAKGEIPAHYENPIRTKSGEERDIVWNNTVLRDVDGNVIGTASIGEDVTERRRAEEALRLSEQRFRQLAESIREVFWLTDPGRTAILYLSPAYETVWGRARESAMAAPDKWLDAVHPDDRGRLLAALPRQASGDYEEEFRIVRPDGAVRWIRDRAFPVHDEKGVVYRIAGVAEDITERKQEEQSRRAMEERFSAIFHSSPVGIAYSTVGGLLIDVNAQLAKMLGYSREEVVGRTVHDLHFWANPGDRAPVMARLQRDGVVLNEEVKFQQKSGDIRTVLLSLQSLQLANEPVFVAMLIDVTQLKAMESQLHRAERMESVGQLASGIAHDMNNILAPIMMAAPLLRMPLRPADVEKTLTTIEVSAKRGADLVRQLLTIGRGADGERAPMDVSGVVSETGKIATETFPKNIDVVVEVAADLWRVRGNAAQLHQVLLNLCVNARDAMPSGGRLRLTAANLSCTGGEPKRHPEMKPGNYVLLTATDTGMGIPAHLAEKIFEPFFTTKELGKGTGLGLSMVAGIVKAHGGLVNLRSREGEGTTFEVFLPATDDATQDTGSRPPAVMLGNDELVLVVDDEESVRTIVRDTLVRHRYRVITATDGADALAAYAQAAGEIKAVLIDLEMPVMDGVTFARALRRVNPRIPLIVSTGLGGDRGPDRRQAELEALDVAAIVTKPYTAERLLAVISKALEKQGAGKR